MKLRFKNKVIPFLVFAFILGFVVNFAGAKWAKATDTKTFEPKVEISETKTWTINFSKELDENTINKENIKVVDQNGNDIDVKVVLRTDKKSIDILPPTSNYTKGQTYSIVVSSRVKDINNKNLKQQTKMSFTIVKDESSTSNDVLTNTREGLIKVKSIVKTQNEKNLASYLIDEINKKIVNQYYKVNSNNVKSKYGALSEVERDDFKKAIFDNFYLEELIEIREILGV